MIPLKDIFSLLATGEFSNLAIGKDHRGNIDEAEYGKIIRHINLAVIEIYKRFKFLEDEVILHAFPSISKYYLRPSYMVSADRINERTYIERIGDYNSINIIEIKDIYDEQEKKVTLNNRFCVPYIKQLSDDTLKITGLSKRTKFSVVFQAYPQLIILNDSFNLDIYHLNIPTTIVEAILYYVAARVYKPIGANNSTEGADKSSSYDHKYELSCQKIEHYGLDIDDDNKDINKFHKQGWV